MQLPRFNAFSIMLPSFPKFDGIVAKALGDAAWLFSALLLLNVALPDGTSLANLNPHPFWVPVLLLTVRHGTRAGLAVAALATILALLFVRPERSGVEDLYTYTARLFLEPALWLTAALVLGEIRDGITRQRAVLATELANALRQRDTIAGYADVLNARIATLERALAFPAKATAEATFRAMHDLRRGRDVPLWTRLATAAERALGPCRLSVLLYDTPEISRYTVPCGMSPDQEDEAKPLRPESRRAILQARLLDPRTRRPFGLVYAENLDRAALSPWSETAFLALSAALAEALDRERARDHEPGVMTQPRLAASAA